MDNLIKKACPYLYFLRSSQFVIKDPTETLLEVSSAESQAGPSLTLCTSGFHQLLNLN